MAAKADHEGQIKLPYRHPRVFSIDSGSAFLSHFVDSLIDGQLAEELALGRDALALAGATIFVPTRRAGRALANVLADRMAGPVLLPRIVPLGDTDEAETSLLLADEGPDDLGAAGEGGALAPAVGQTDRLITLAGLVAHWARHLREAIRTQPAGGPSSHTPSMSEPWLVGTTCADALALAVELAQLLDGLAIEGKRITDLTRVVPGAFDRYWEITLDFLKIVTDFWPAHLAENGLLDLAARRDALIRQRTLLYREKGAGGPVIVAGSTGSMPATAALIATIAHLPSGAVVLPGLDLDLDEPSWRLLEHSPSHPQAVLAQLLRTIAIERSNVERLGTPPPFAIGRARILSAAMRPSETSDGWAAMRALPGSADDIAQALSGIAIIEAEDEREEALAIAVALREAIEKPGATAALITPDRALSERVCTALARWNILVDDSAGMPLTRSPRGALVSLAAEAAAGGFASRDLLALLAHPLARFGLSRAEIERAASALEIGALRGYPASRDLEALSALIPQRREKARDRRAPYPARRVRDADWDLATDLLARIAEAFKPLTAVARTGAPVPFTQAMAALRLALERITLGEDGEDRLFIDSDGEAFARLFDEVEATKAGGLALTLAELPAAFGALASSIMVTPPRRAHRRIKIWGLLEARLLHADRVVLGGLNETIWPPQTRTDPFLNRAMRNALGLAPPERRIGQSAHDFVQAFGARDLVLSRAGKSGGVPSVPSRFLQRLRAYAGQADGKDAPDWSAALKRGERFLTLARLLDKAPATPSAARPSPIPATILVPRSLSFSEIETLVRDPYAIHARHVLALDPLPEIDAQADFALRGTIIHDAVATFAEQVDPAAPDALAQMLAIGRRAFAEAGLEPERGTFWWPRFERIAAWLVAWERKRRLMTVAAPKVEIRAQHAFPLHDGTSFTLRGIADRIDRFADGSLAIVDFKTGSTPSMKEVMVGFAPQLTLEAAIAARGGFEAFPGVQDISQIAYVILNGSSEGGKEQVLAFEDAAKTPRELMEVAEGHLQALLKRMNEHVSGACGFTARVFPKYRDTAGRFDHLARVPEWSKTGYGGEEG